MWAIVTQPNLRLASLQSTDESSSGHGALVAQTVEACSIVLRNVVSVVVSSDGGAKEDAQAALEAIYRHHVVQRLVEACRVYGASLSEKCVAAVVTTLSELVLASSKFLAQVGDFSYKPFFLLMHCVLHVL